MFKSRFPYFNKPHTDKEVPSREVYLDSAATTQRLDSVLDITHAYYKKANASVHRGSYASAKHATTLYEEARKHVQNLISASKQQEVIFTSGATESLNMVANGLNKGQLQGTVILVMASEHHANLVPWQALAKRFDLRIEVINLSSSGVFAAEEQKALLEQLRSEVAILALAHVSNALGNVYPVQEIISEAKQHNIISVIDGTQAVAHLNVDVQALDCDFYAFSGHKMYGPTGIGVLYGKLPLLESLSPSKLGGEMVLDVDYENASFQEPPLKFEGGTPNIAGAIGLGAAAEYVESNLPALIKSENALLVDLIAQLRLIDGVNLYGNISNNLDNSIATASITVEQINLNDLAIYLSQAGIAVRIGHHCAMPLMKKLNIAGTLRVSLACYNEKNDIDSFIEQLKKGIQVLQDSSTSDIQVAANKHHTQPELQQKPANDNRENRLPIAQKISAATGWDNKYRQLLLASKQLQILAPEDRIDEFAVDGCESPLWLSIPRKDGALRYAAYSQSKVVRGILAVLFEKANELSSSNKDLSKGYDYYGYLEQIGIAQYFSQGRRDGISNAILAMT